VKRELLCGLAGILGGASYAAAFEPYGQPALAWVALALPLTAIAVADLRGAFVAGFFFGITQAALSIHWMWGLFGAMSLSLFVIYAAYSAIAFSFAQAVVERFGRHALMWGVPAVFVSVEWLRSEGWWLKFAFFTAGSSQHSNVWLLQTASWWGVYGLSAIVIAANGAIAYVAITRKWRVAVIAALAVAALHGAGRIVLSLQPSKDGPGLEVASIEGSFLWTGAFEKRVDEAMALAPGTQLVVLPEFASNEELSEGHEDMKAMVAVARKHGVTLVFGGKEKQGDDFRNTLFVLGPDGRLLGRQAKSVPVPFFRDGLPAIDRAPVATPAGLLGCATCYDMDFPFVARELVNEGAELLVFPTMEVAGAAQKRQHLELAALRAVEHRRWIVRCASSGISCLVDPCGRVTVGGGVMCARVERRTGKTLYTRVGYGFPHVCVIVAVALILIAAKRSRRPPSVEGPRAAARSVGSRERR